MDDYEFDYLADFREMNAEFAENMANYQFVEWFKKMQDEPAIEDLDGADFSVRQETYQRMIKMWKNSQLSPEALSRLSPAEQESARNIRRMVVVRRGRTNGATTIRTTALRASTPWGTTTS